MIKLKDGSTTKDPRLTRVVQFDDKSLNFPVTAVIENQTPRSYTWKCDLHLNQLAEGSCTGHAFAHELAAYPVPVKGMTHKYATESIYWEAQKNDEWPGGA